LVWKSPQKSVEEPRSSTPVVGGPMKTIEVAHQLHLPLFTNMAH
jgi:hypothetical protein